MDGDDLRVYDLVVRRFLAAFHPEAVLENTRVETTVAEHVFRTRGKVLLVPGWRGVYLPSAEEARAADARGRRGRAARPGAAAARAGRALARARGRVAGQGDQAAAPLQRRVAARRRWRRPASSSTTRPLREAMKDSGIGTPATRAAIIERLIDVGYVERDGRALVATEKGLNVIRLLGEHALTSPDLTGAWEQRLGRIERGEDSRERFMRDIAGFAKETVEVLDETLKDVRIPRATLGPCPVCGHEIVENRKGYSCWARDDPGCGFVIWKGKAGKQLPIAVARELIATGRTERPVTGFRGRSGRSFRARLALMQTPEGQVARRLRRAVGARGCEAARGRGRGRGRRAPRAPPAEERDAA